MIMLRYLLPILIAAAAAGADESLPRRSETADLTAGVLRYDYVASASLDPQWTGSGVIVYDNNAVSFPFHPGLAGRLKMSFVMVSGGEFGPCTIELNGQPVTAGKTVAGTATRQVLEGVSPSLANRWNTLTVTAPPGRKIGLGQILWEPLEWRELPPESKVWQVRNPGPGRDFAWRLETEQPAELLIAGRRALKVPAGRHSGILPSATIGAGTREWRLATAGKFSFQINRVDDVEITAGLLPLQAAAPEKTALLANPVLRLVFTLPTDGMNNGARFMTMGLTPSIRLNGRELAGTLGDGISGLAEEFVEPAGFAAGGNGAEFLKFGVGVFRRGSDPVYSTGGVYPPVKIFPWQVEAGPTVLRCIQTAAWQGWAYRYEKTYRLDPNRAILRVEHRFRNTGDQTIVTSHYCHNLFRLGVDRIGPEHETAFNFNFGYRQVIGDMARPEGKRFKIIPGTGQTTFFRLSKFTGATENFASLSAGTLSLTIRGDFVPYRIFFYCCPTAASPEFHRRLELAPGGEATWTTEYEFGIANHKHKQENQP